MIKAIFFDADGTLLSFNTHRLSPVVRDTLLRARKKGIKLILATGRYLREMESAGLLDCPLFDGLMSINGHLCLDAHGQILMRRPMDRADVRALYDYFVKTGTPGQFTDMNSGWLTPHHPSFEPDLSEAFAEVDLPVPPVKRDLSDIDGIDIYQVSIFCDERAMDPPLPQLHRSHLLRWHPHFADIIPAVGGKADSMDVYLSRFGIDLSETMAIGDGENDIAMLRRAAVGVAMGNAPDSVKKAVNYVTSSVDEDGVARAIEHFCF